MPLSSTSQDPQLQALYGYTLLRAIQSDWAGALLLNVLLDPAGCALSLAANVAGAACLTVEPDATRSRAALRSGACDFVVNTLDEALRAVKNEVRQRRPLSVCLEGSPAAFLYEIVARGVAPQLFTAPGEFPAEARSLAGFSTRLLDLRGSGDMTNSPEALLESFLGQEPRSHLSLVTRTFPSSAELRAFDAQALTLLPPEDQFRRRWLTHSARLFSRDRHRTLWVTHTDRVALACPDATPV